MRLSPSCSPHKNASDSAAISNSGVAPTRIVETGLIVTSPGLSSAHANFMVASVTPSSCLSYVVTALCSHHACGPFALIQVEDYALRGQNSR